MGRGTWWGPGSRETYSREGAKTGKNRPFLCSPPPGYPPSFFPFPYGENSKTGGALPYPLPVSRARTPYPWESPTWEALRRALAHPGNRYRYGLLLPPGELPPQEREGLRVFPLPEGGWLVLSREVRVGNLELQDLAQRPLRVGPFLLTWGGMKRDKTRRARFLVSPAWVREKQKELERLVGSFRWPHDRKRVWVLVLAEARRLVGRVNALTREIREASKVGFLPPSTANRWDKAVRRALRKALTGLGLTRGEISELTGSVVRLKRRRQ